MRETRNRVAGGFGWTRAAAIARWRDVPLAAGIGVSFVALAVTPAVVGRVLAHLLSE